jgi:hypothetical protein
VLPGAAPIGAAAERLRLLSLFLGPHAHPAE